MNQSRVGKPQSLAQHMMLSEIGGGCNQPSRTPSASVCIPRTGSPRSRLFVQFISLALILYGAVVVMPKIALAQSGCRCSSCSCGGSNVCGCGCTSSTINLADAQLQESLPATPQALSFTAGCSGGMAGAYPCQGVNLHSQLGLAAMGGGTANRANDIWGWTSPDTGIDYALVGRTDGTRFVDLSDPTNPIYLGNLPRTTGTSITTWRDIKVYNNHAYVVADFGSGSSSNHGMQVFNLSMLDTVDRSVAMTAPLTFSPNSTYTGFTRAHNLAINEDTGFAYALGSNTHSGGLHAINLQNPTSPTFAGGYSGDGYNHDANVVLYSGPDATYAGRELSFSSNEDTLTIVDITNKSSPSQVSRATYRAASYSHQGWLTEDHRYFIMNDELDERDRNDVNLTRSHIWDVSDLQNPLYLGFESLRSGATDHNLYINNGLVLEANYRSGLRILDTRDIRNGDLYEVGWFDIDPSSDSPGFDGAWSVYQFPDSGVTIVSGISQGLFVLDTSSIVAGSPTMGLMNGSFEHIERGQSASVLPEDFQLFFSGERASLGSGVNGYDFDVPGWVERSSTIALLRHITDNDIIGGAADGTNVLVLASQLTPIMVQQTLADVLENDKLYTLSVEVGQSLLHSLNSGYEIGLYAGDTLLKSISDTDIGAPQLTQGAFTYVELNVDSRDYLAYQGLPLQIRLSTSLLADGADIGRTLFDDVQFDIENIQLESSLPAIPEPGSIYLLLLSCLFWRCRRFRRAGCIPEY